MKRKLRERNPTNVYSFPLSSYTFNRILTDDSYCFGIVNLGYSRTGAIPSRTDPGKSRAFLVSLVF